MHMRMISLGLNGVLLIAAGLASSCNYRREKVAMPLALEASFTSVRTYILEPKCLGCHTGPSSPEGADLSTYEALMNGGWVVPGSPATSRLFLSVTRGNMPKNAPRLSETELGLLENWIVAGATAGPPSNQPPPEPEPEPEPSATWAWVGGVYFKKNCLQCHDGTHEKTKLDLRTHATAMEFSGDVLKAIEADIPELSGVYRSLSEKLMPPKGPEASEKELAAIYQWISEGAKP